MLIGSRGLGKAEPITNLILTKDGWVKMGNITVGTKVYSRSGRLCNVTNIYPQGKKRICRLKFADDRTIDCCEDHLWVAKKGCGKEITISTKEMINDGLTWSSNDKYAYKYKVPHCNPIVLDKKDLLIDPYILGCLLGDGTMNAKTPKIASNDIFIIDEFKKKLEGFEIKIDPTNNNYTLVDRNKEYTEITRRNGKYLSRNKNRLTNKIEQLKLNVDCKNKFIPDEYKYSSIEDRMELVRGLLDTDGSINGDGSIEFTGVCEKLVDDLIEVLRSLGISCIKSSDNRTGQKYILPSGKESIRGFCYRVYINTSQPVFKLPRKLERIKKKETGKEKYNAIVSAEYIDDFVDMQCISVDSEDHTYITKDYIVTHNTFSLALYSLLRAIFLPGRKIVIVGAGFRQSKLVFDYIETIWNNSPLLRDFVGNLSVNRPTHGTDTCKFTLGESTILAIPVGSGDKIRGIRCVSSDTIIQTDIGLIEIGQYCNTNAYQVLNINNQLETPTQIIKTPLTDVYQVTTVNGYQFKCSNIHTVMTDKGWKLAKDLTNKDHLLLDHNSYFPTNYIEKNQIKLDEKLSWIIGALVSEGTVTNRNYISFINTDKSFIDKMKDFVEFDWIETYRPAYKDKRGFNCKESWTIKYSNTEYRTMLKNFGLEYSISLDKVIPDSILQSPKSVVVSFLSGLFEGDATCFQYKDRNDLRIGVAYYTSSLKLAKQLQVLLLKFGIICGLHNRSENKLSNKPSYLLAMRGENAYKITQLLDIIKWKDKFDNSNFLVKKPQIRSVTKKTTRWYLSTTEGNKNKHLGSFSTKEEAEKYFYEYKESSRSLIKVKSVEKLDKQEHLYDFYLPETHSFIGNGFIQHNSNDLIVDEFSSHSEEIFENVIAGFGAVSSSPAIASKRKAAEKLAKALGIEFDNDSETSRLVSNQIIISGTAYYHFNHFYKYWKRWKTIIESKGDHKKLKSIFPEDIPEGFNYRDYSIMRIPVEMLPLGFMDEGQIARSKATLHTGLFNMEFSACFSLDSQGFFRASLVQSCVANKTNAIIKKGSEEHVFFHPKIYGNKDKQYIYAIDPASEQDNFSLTILELHEDHRRVVYQWTTNSQDFKERRKSGEFKETDFYGFCARKIRNLMKTFPTNNIAIDSQGGGKAIYEALHDKNKVEVGEQMIWEVIENGKDKDCDGEEGLHIIHLINFAKEEFTSGANHGLKKDLEDKVLLFPEHDISYNAILREVNDEFALVMEDCIIEIEELKKELTQIVVTSTASGRERWDTPEIKISGMEKGRLRKDRYSSLLMANYIARNLTELPQLELGLGGFARSGGNTDGKDFHGPAWLVNQLNTLY